MMNLFVEGLFKSLIFVNHFLNFKLMELRHILGFYSCFLVRIKLKIRLTGEFFIFTNIHTQLVQQTNLTSSSSLLIAIV